MSEVRRDVQVDVVPIAPRKGVLSHLVIGICEHYTIRKSYFIRAWGVRAMESICFKRENCFRSLEYNLVKCFAQIQIVTKCEKSYIRCAPEEAAHRERRLWLLHSPSGT